MKIKNQFDFLQQFYHRFLLDVTSCHNTNTNFRQFNSCLAPIFIFITNRHHFHHFSISTQFLHIQPTLAMMKREDAFTKWITEGFQFKMYSRDGLQMIFRSR